MRNGFIFSILIMAIFNCSQNQIPPNSETRKLRESIFEQARIKQKKSFDDNFCFKVDSSRFQVSIAKNRLTIRCERDSSFQSQRAKIEKALSLMSKEMDLSTIEGVLILPVNKELLNNIALVPEIQSELIKKRKGGIVNSMGIVSRNANKSEFLSKITKLFFPLNLKAHSIYIDKCGVDKKESPIGLTMNCATIYFSLKKESTKH